MSRVMAGVVLVCLILLCGSGQTPPAKTEPEPVPPEPAPQEIPVQKPRYDYMDGVLSRSTSPLGLKEDLLARELLQQSRTKWAVRAGLRHVFD
jgi:hypothetical protein